MKDKMRVARIIVKSLPSSEEIINAIEQIVVEEILLDGESSTDNRTN